MSGPSQNWQARTLVGSCLKKQVDLYVSYFKTDLEQWQRDGDLEDGWPLYRLKRRLKYLESFLTLFYYCDSPEAHEAIDAFRKDNPQLLSDEEVNS